MRSLTHSFFWGISVALSWTWGLGLFFSVQIALMFGITGLLSFAIPNALGLMLFGTLVNNIAKKYPDAAKMEKHFFTTSNTMRFVILAYQFVAIALTFFAIFAYLFRPIGLDLVLGVLLVLGAAMLLGEQFDIRRIRFSHTAMFIIVVLCAVGVAYGMSSIHQTQGIDWRLYNGFYSWKSTNYVGFLIPIIAGLLLGPWLDIQQWQRAIQVHREKGSIQLTYFFGGALFFLVLLFHGVLALTVLGVTGPEIFRPSFDGLFHAKDAVVLFIFDPAYGSSAFMRVCYFTFLVLCVVSTLDSGYVALKWYLKELTRKSEHIIFTLIPEGILRTPVLPMIIAVGTAAVAVIMKAELEYFMSFYASFGVGYAIVFLFRTTYKPQFTNFTQTTLFSVAAFSLGLFGVGYFREYWFCMVLGAVIPLIHGFVTISSRVVVDDLQKALPNHESSDGTPVGSISGKAAEMTVHGLHSAISRLDPKVAQKFSDAINRIEPQAAHALATILHAVQPIAEGLAGPTTAIDINSDIEHAKGHFEGKWFTYTFMATYNDTNSVGNVYFANYVQWVGKVREMFFNTCMPSFNLTDTKFYILTRSIDHKFNMEAREFEFITVKIRVESFNRKFATLEHNIFNQSNQLLGKGHQVLLFVSSADYGIVDMPNEVKNAFLPHC